MERRAYTAVELVVTAAVTALLLALVVPAVVGSREESRKKRCQNNLRQLGVGLLVHAERDPYTRYCTGATDWYRDGCPDSIGWVADLVNMDHARPIDLLCPSNPLVGHESLADVCTRDYTLTEDDGSDDPSHWHYEQFAAAGVCGAGATVWGTGGTPVRTAAVEKYLLDKGYGSNYTASWYLVRGGPRMTVAMGPSPTRTQVEWMTFSTLPLQGSSGWKSLANTTGPLLRRDADKSKHPSGLIPLLGDGGPGDAGTSTLPADLRFGGKRFLLKGDRLVESFNAGPVTYHGTSLVPLAGKTLVGQVTGLDTVSFQWSGQIYEEAMGCTYGCSALQDTRGWICHHRGAANLLFADGSVREYADANRDGLLNPGFAVKPSAAPSAPAPDAGYVDGQEDLPRTEVFSGLFIKNVAQRRRCYVWSPDVTY